MSELKKCCCGKYEVEENKPFQKNNILHEAYIPGKDNFCGPVKNHDIRDLKSQNKRLRELLGKCKKILRIYACGNCENMNCRQCNVAYLLKEIEEKEE